jgi:hypothetical protein
LQIIQEGYEVKGATGSITWWCHRHQSIQEEGENEVRLVYLGEQADEEGKEEGKGLYRPTRRKKQRPGPAISKPAG